METTIAAISTPKGIGGMGVIRISGENALETADSIFESVSGKKVTNMKGYTASYGKITDNGEIIDEAVVLVFREPHSYTGEDVVEISCHGGMYLTRRVLRAVLSHGAKPAQGGEFTKRAFLNGKIGLTEAESVMDIISASGSQAAKAALSAMEGSLRKRIDIVKSELLTLAAHLAAWADYPEEEIPEIDDVELKEGLEKCEESDKRGYHERCRQAVNTVRTVDNIDRSPDKNHRKNRYIQHDLHIRLPRHHHACCIRQADSVTDHPSERVLFLPSE